MVEVGLGVGLALGVEDGLELGLGLELGVTLELVPGVGLEPLPGFPVPCPLTPERSVVLDWFAPSILTDFEHAVERTTSKLKVTKDNVFIYCSLSF